MAFSLQRSVTLYFGDQFSLLTNNYDIYVNKILICCLLTVSKVVVKFRYGIGLRDRKYGHAE